MFQNRETTLNGPNRNDHSPKRSPTVYIRSQEPTDQSSYQGVVTYQIVKAQQGEVTQLSPISQTNSTPRHAQTAKEYTNSSFQPDDVFLFPETVSRSTSTGYEEIASPRVLEKAVVIPQRPNSNGMKPQHLHVRYNSDEGPSKSNVSKEDAFII